MANTNSDLITKQAAALTGLSGGVVNGDDANGLVLRAQAIVTLPSGVADADTFAICDLPPGAVPIPQLSSVACSADPGTTLLLDVGYSDATEGGSTTDADGLADGITLSSGGLVNFCSGTMPAAVATPVRTTRKTRVTAVVPTSGASTVTAGVKLVFTIAYAVKG